MLKVFGQQCNVGEKGVQWTLCYFAIYRLSLILRESFSKIMTSSDFPSVWLFQQQEENTLGQNKPEDKVVKCDEGGAVRNSL